MSKLFSNHLARAVLALLTVSGVSSATGFTVNNTTDTTNPGSLRWALTQAQNPVGAPHVITFAIPPCTPAPCASRIQINTELPPITQALTIDGATQANTNPGQLGMGGTVGLDVLPFAKFNAPDVAIYKGTGAVAYGLKIEASNVVVKGLAIYGFGGIANSSTQANSDGQIVVWHGTNNISGTLITQNVLGASETGAPPGPLGKSAGIHVFGTNGAPNVFSGSIDGNLIAYNEGVGIRLANTAAKWIITRNEIFANGRSLGVGGLDGISFDSFPANNTFAAHDVLDNLIYANEGCGVDSYATRGGTLIRNNTIYQNGIGNVTLNPSETFGIRITAGTLPRNTNNKIERNEIYSNYGGGVSVASFADAEIFQNSLFFNGTIQNRFGTPVTNGIGIDLFATGDGRAPIAPFVNLNDNGDADQGGNDMLNAPVIETAEIQGPDLVLSGFAQPGAKVEFYIADPDPSGFGEGLTPFVNLIEGSPADTNSGSGSYAGFINGLDQGSDTTNRFTFRIPLPPGLTEASTITALSHLAGRTSEFSGLAPVSTSPADLELESLTLSMNPTRVGGPEYSYFVAVKNNGPGPASNLSMTLNVPPMVSMNSFIAPSWTCSQMTTTITCTRASMTSGLMSVIEIRATSMVQGSFSVDASVTHSGPDLLASNNFKNVTQAVVTNTADLQLNANVFPQAPSAGAPVTYELTIGNLGPDPSSEVSASLTLPSGSSYQSFSGINWSCTGSGNSVNCTRPGVLGFPSQTLLSVVALAPTIVGGGHSYNLAVGASTPDGFPSNNTASGVLTVGAGADIQMGSVANPNPVGTGQEITFSLFVTNLSATVLATDPYVDVFLGPGVTYKSYSAPPGWTCGPSEGSIACTAASQGNVPTQINIYATSLVPGTAEITAYGGANNDTNPTNEMTTASTVVLPTADLAITNFIASPLAPKVNSPITVEATIVNIGYQAADNPIVTLQLPPGVSYGTNLSPSWTCGVSGFLVTCTLPFLEGTSVLSITVIPAQPGQFSSVASVSSKTLDPVATNNSKAFAGVVHECNAPSDCSGGKTICEAGSVNYCRECLVSQDCPVTAPVCDVGRKVCTVSTCVTDNDCPGLLNRCDVQTGKCVQCLDNAHCAGGLVCANKACEKCDPLNPGATCSSEREGSACVVASERLSCGCLTDAFCGPSNSGRVCTVAKSCIDGCRGTGGNGCTAGYACTSTTNAIGVCQPVATTDAGADGSVVPSDAGITDGSMLPGLPDGSVILSDGGVLLPDGAVVSLPDAGTPENPNTRPSIFDNAGYDTKSTNAPAPEDCSTRSGPRGGAGVSFFAVAGIFSFVALRLRRRVRRVKE